MALLDSARGVVVLRIVYDGPPGAGKTTSVRALGAKLARPTTTPDELGGRTMYFDWLDYTAGQFEGKKLRCQVVTVPGQERLRDRREYLLSTADVVVHVNQVTEETLPEVIENLKLVRTRSIDGMPLGVILQANKSDEPQSIGISSIREALEQERLPVMAMQSSATLGTGVREAFVFAVRLALDRVEELSRRGTLREGTPEIDDPDALFGAMRRRFSFAPPPGVDAENASHDAEPGAAAVSVRAPSVRMAETNAPSTSQLESQCPPAPTVDVPPGHVWPAMEGRITLAHATDLPPIFENKSQAFSARTAEGWAFYSAQDAHFTDLDDARRAMLEMARLYAAYAEFMSGPRCLVLAPDGNALWRLWQIARDRLSLSDRLKVTLPSADRTAHLLVDSLQRLEDIRFKAPELDQAGFPLTLENVGVERGRTVIVGFWQNRSGAPSLRGADLELLAQTPAQITMDATLREALGALAKDNSNAAKLLAALEKSV